MKNKTHSFLFAILLLITASAISCEQKPKEQTVEQEAEQPKEEYLIKVSDEMDTKFGYINTSGDTVIALGKYAYCFTDTLKDYAIVMKNDGVCIAIDKNDNELYEVFLYDNGPDYLADGLFRIKKNGKIGYANEDGEIIIEPQFDCAFPFEDGKAKVSNECTTVQDGEYQSWESDNWIFIDKSGNKIE